MFLRIDERIRNQYPDVELGWIKAEVKPLSEDPAVEIWKESLAAELASAGVTMENLSSQPDVAGWRQVFASMGVKPSKYRSSLEALLRRVLKENALWTVNSVVDLYNCVSVRTFVPMGAFDLDKVKGDIELRFGKEGEIFSPLGKGEVEAVLPGHVVYADQEKVCCWLWNHRDSRLVGLGLETKRALFMADHAFSPTSTSTEDALKVLWEKLEETGSSPLAMGVCSARCPEVEIG